MGSEKKAMWVVFKMKEMPAKEEMRERFCQLYHIYRDHPAMEFKVWHINEEKLEWGGFYIFKSQELLDEYLKSDLWTKEIPGRWGVQPEYTIVDLGPVLCKGVITEPEDSWISG
jgi:hypothetical protein